MESSEEQRWGVECGGRGIGTWHQLPGVESTSLLTEASISNMAQASPWPSGNPARQGSTSVQDGPTTEAVNSGLPQPGGTPSSFQLEFQDSSLSPALPLLPASYGKVHSLLEDTTFHHTDLEFIALRGSPDVSAFERFSMARQVGDPGMSDLPEVAGLPELPQGGLVTDHASLSEQTGSLALVSGEDASSCWSLSQHPMSPVPGNGDKDGQCVLMVLEKDLGQDGPQSGTEGEHSTFDGSSSHAGSQERLQKMVTKEDGFLSREMPVHLDTIAKDTGDLGSSRTSGESNEVFPVTLQKNYVNSEGQKSMEPKENVSKTKASCQSTEYQKCPSGTTSFNQENVEFLDKEQNNNSDGFHKQRIQFGTEADEDQSRPLPKNSWSVTPNTGSMGTYSERASTTVEVPVGISKAEPQWSAGSSFERGHTEKGLSSSGNQTAVEGSFLRSFEKPVSQSTPSVFFSQAIVQPSLGKLFAVESNVEVSLASAHESQSVPCEQPPDHSFDNNSTVLSPGNKQPGPLSLQESGRIQTLPALSYMEKVGAWNVNQTSGKAYFDNLTLRRFSPRRNLAVSFSVTASSAREAHSLPGSGGSTPSPVGGLDPFSRAAKRAQPAGALQSVQKRSSDSGNVPPGIRCSTSSLTRNLVPSDSEFLSGSSERQASQIEHRHSEPGTECTKTLVDPSVLQKCNTGVTQGTTGRVESADVSEVQESDMHLPEVNLHHLSHVPTNQDLGGMLANSQNICQSKQNLAASTGAVSSVLSVDIDYSTPYWPTDPSSPARDKEMNIDERIPTYLRNLGIDQSPSTILTPFVPRGPIREPEFSPTDLCTIKDSIETPTKSTQPSGGNTPEKGEFSRFSIQSVGSSVSIPLSVDSLHLSQCSLQAAFHPLGASLDHLPQEPPEMGTLCAGKHPVAGISHQPLGDDNITRECAQEFMESFKPSKVETQDRGFSVDQFSGPSLKENGNDSFMGSKTLQEIDKLLDKAETTVSGRSSVSSSSSSIWGSENSLLRVQSKLGSLQSSFASMGNRETSCLLWDKPSSESLLTSDGLKEVSFRESFKYPESVTHRLTAPKGAVGLPTGENAGPSSLHGILRQPAGLCDKSVRREPEGCSAGVADPAIPVVVSAAEVGSPEATSGMQPQEVRSPSRISSSGSGATEPACDSRGVDQNAESDGSAADSLAARVASLLRNESPATVASSGPSIAGDEERRAREWIKWKDLGQQREPLDLNILDRQRIEEIKREFLLCTKYQTKSQLSRETDSSTQSSRDGLEAEPRRHAGQFMALKTAEHLLTGQLQQLSRKPLDSGVQLDLEARVRDIAQREDLTISGAVTPSITSMTTSTSHQSFSTPTCPTGPASVPLDFGILPGSSAPQPHVSGHTSETTGGIEKIELGSPSDVQSCPMTLGTKDSSDSCLPAPTGQERPPHDSINCLTALNQFPGFSTGTPFSLNLASSSQMSQSLLDVGRPPSNQMPCVAPSHIAPLASVSSSICSPNKNLPHLHLTLTTEQSCADSSEFILVKHSQEDGSTSVKELQAGLLSDSSSRLTSQVLHDVNVKLTKQSDVPLDSQASAEQSVFFPAPGMTSSTNTERKEESVRSPYHKVAEASVQFSTCVPIEESRSSRPTADLPQPSSFPNALMPGPLSIQTPAMPVLLPYKPHGSPELFYMPQMGAQLSPVHSNTTLESSHPGSDDALPPKFSMDVLGSRDQEADCAVTIRHTEGIYSKRVQGTNIHPGVKIQGSSMSEGGDSPTKGSYHSQWQDSLSLERPGQGRLCRAPGARDGVSPFKSSLLKASNSHRRNQWPPGSEPTKESMFFNQTQDQDEFAPLLGQADESIGNSESFYRREVESLGKVGLVAVRQGMSSGHRTSQRSGSVLDELRRRSSQRRSLQGTTEMEKSLLERLERLSRLIHNTGVELERANILHKTRDGQQPGGRRGRGETGQERRTEVEPAGMRREPSSRPGREEAERKQNTDAEGEDRSRERKQGNDTRRTKEGRRTRKRTEGENSRKLTEAREISSGIQGPREQPLRQAWGEGTLRATPGYPVSQHHCPAERDCPRNKSGETDVSVQTESGDTTGTASTIDTARLVRAFGAERVIGGPGMVYRQRGRRKDGTRHMAPAFSQTDSTDESTATPESITSSSSYCHLPHREPRHGLLGKKPVKLVSKGIQAGDLEIVNNGTRKHTRDVGTTFPSPRTAQAVEVTAEVTQDCRSPPRHPTISNERSRRSQHVHYPRGVSWFVPAENLKARSKKENRPESTSVPRSGLVWFEPYTKTKPWREPLRERQVQEGPMGSRPEGLVEPITSPESNSKVLRSFVPITLQEALELHRPDFISRSQERMKRLGLQVEERRLQAIFAQQREDLFNWPGHVQTRLQSTGPPVYARKAVPKKEMFMRSKRMYAQLPEVRRRNEEEKRKAEYRSYRLKAQLYKTKITNHILGRRTPWQ